MPSNGGPNSHKTSENPNIYWVENVKTYRQERFTQSLNLDLTTLDVPYFHAIFALLHHFQNSKQLSDLEFSSRDTWA